MPNKEFISIGKIASIEKDHKVVDSATKGQAVAMKVRPRLWLFRHDCGTADGVCKLSWEAQVLDCSCWGLRAQLGSWGHGLLVGLAGLAGQPGPCTAGNSEEALHMTLFRAALSPMC